MNRNGSKQEFLIGYAKVHAEKLGELLIKSGHAGVFLGRLARERQADQYVSWLYIIKGSLVRNFRSYEQLDSVVKW